MDEIPCSIQRDITIFPHTHVCLNTETFRSRRNKNGEAANLSRGYRGQHLIGAWLTQCESFHPGLPQISRFRRRGVYGSAGLLEIFHVLLPAAFHPFLFAADLSRWNRKRAKRRPAAADGLNNCRRENEPEGKKRRARVVPPLGRFAP